MRYTSFVGELAFESGMNGQGKDGSRACLRLFLSATRSESSISLGLSGYVGGMCWSCSKTLATCTGCLGCLLIFDPRDIQ